MKNAYFAIMAIPVIIGVLVVAYMVQEPQESDGITTTGLLSEASPILGSADARITIIEWGDYQCEFCHKFHQNTLGVIKEKYVNSGSVNIVFRDFVLNGPDSEFAALHLTVQKIKGCFGNIMMHMYMKIDTIRLQMVLNTICQNMMLRIDIKNVGVELMSILLPYLVDSRTRSM